MPKKPKVYIIMVNWNNYRDTVECLESVFRLDYEPLQVIVCDNGSTDDSIAMIQSWAVNKLPANTVSGRTTTPQFLISRREAELGVVLPGDQQLVIVDCDKNLGFAGGNNVGLRYALARGDFGYVWLLNNDTVVDRHALSNLVNRITQKPGAGMCGSTLLLYDRPHRVQALGGGYYCRWIGLPWHIGRMKTVKSRSSPEWSERWMNYIVGASLLVSKEFIESVGLMEEEYFLYFEELDWAIRGKGRFTLAYAPESVVYHKVGASIGTTSNPATKSYLCDFFNIRNRVAFTRKYYPYALPTIYLSLMAAMLVRALCGKWERVLMIWRIIAGMQQPDYSVGTRH